MQNGIIGDNLGIDLPVTNVDDESLQIEKNMAKFSKTREFNKLKEHLESRIHFYENFLPDGRPLASVDADKVGANWVIANAIIGEFKAVLQAYENAKVAVDGR